jgi:hypothetical protein
MHVAPGEIAEHFLRFLIEAVTGARIRGEHRNGADVAQRWNARDEDLSRMTAGIKKIVFILLAWGDVTGERVRRTIAFVCTAAFAAAGQRGCDYDRNRDRILGFCFHCRSFLLSLLFHCHDALGALRVMPRE